MKLKTKHYVIILVLILIILLIPRTFMFPPIYRSEALGWYYSQARLVISEPFGFPLHNLQFGNIVQSVLFTPVLIIYILEFFILLGIEWLTLAQLIPIFLVPLLAVITFYWFRKFGNDISAFFGTLFFLTIPITFRVLFTEINYYIFVFIIFSLSGFLYMRFLETRKRSFLIFCGITSGILIGSYAPAAIVIFIFYFSTVFNIPWKNSKDNKLFDKKIFTNFIFIFMIAISVFLVMDGPFLFFTETPYDVLGGDIITSQKYFTDINMKGVNVLDGMFTLAYTSELFYYNNLLILIFLSSLSLIAIIFLRKNRMVQALIIFSIFYILFSFLISSGDFSIDPTRTAIIQNIIPFNPTFIHGLTRIVFYFISLPILAGLGMYTIFKKDKFKIFRILLIIFIVALLAVQFYRTLDETKSDHVYDYKSLQNAYIWLREQPDGMVVANCFGSGAVFAITGKKSVTDTWVGLSGQIGWEEYYETINDMRRLYTTESLEEANQLINRYNISYVLSFSRAKGFACNPNFNLYNSFNKTYDDTITQIYSTRGVDMIG